MKKLFILFFVLVFLNPLSTTAQLSNNGLTPSITIDLQPSFPRPGENVSAKLNDFRLTTSRSLISWYVNGVEIIESKNLRETSFLAGEVGKEQVITAVLTNPSGTAEVIETTIVPIYLDIVVEPQTRVPDFYQGRPLPSLGSIVNVTGIISGIPVDESELVYTWRVERRVIGGGGIRGGKQVSFAVPMGNRVALSLEVSDLRGRVIASRYLFVPSVAPSILFYEISPLFGSGRHSISDSFQFIGNTITIKAEPYNLDLRTYNNPGTSVWKINGVEVSNNSNNPHEASLQKTGVNGQAKIEYQVRDLTQILQGAKETIRIKF
jgi:hypothetical protein